MNPASLISAAILLAVLPPTLRAAELTLTAPIDYQVVQRHSANEGTLRIAGTIDGARAATDVEVRLGSGGNQEWRKLTAVIDGEKFSGEIAAPAGGWYRVEARVLAGGTVLAKSSVPHVGVGEVFVVAGQSNSANHGSERQATKTGRVAAFDGSRWKPANDPQPGASGRGGSFLPPFGDTLVERLDVPIGFIACGIGATSVREWLPKDATFPNPPTIEKRVTRLPDGTWASKGDAYRILVSRMMTAGPRGFRAVLWHQGESDANQKDPARTLAGNLYAGYLARVIRDSRAAIGWEAPWFVAQVSYHGPGDEACPAIRAAQASLWKTGLAEEGPDSDALKRQFRARDGQGVHFSGPGLREHARRWADKVAPWVQANLEAGRPARQHRSADRAD